jgi:hypothetical protein
VSQAATPQPLTYSLKKKYQKTAKHIIRQEPEKRQQALHDTQDNDLKSLKNGSNKRLKKPIIDNLVNKLIIPMALFIPSSGYLKENHLAILPQCQLLT